MDEPVFTVFQSLQDEYVAKNLQLDLGSLPAFLDLRSTDTVPILGGGQCRKFQSKRKRLDQPKKYEQPTEEEDEFNPNHVVQAIFQEVFQINSETFEQQHSLMKLEKTYKFQDVDALKRKLLKLPKEKQQQAFKEELDKLNQNVKTELKLKMFDGGASTKQLRIRNSGSASRKDQGDESRKHSISRFPDPKQKQFFMEKTQTIRVADVVDDQLHLQRRMDNLLKLKFKYSDVAAVWKQYWGETQIGQSTSYDEHLKANIKPALLTEFTMLYHMDTKQTENQKGTHYKTKSIDSEPIVILRPHKQMTFRNKEVRADQMIYLAITSKPWVTAQKVEFVHTNMDEATMKLLLTVLGECRHLEYLDLSYNQISETTCLMLASILRCQSLRQIKLASMGINTKMFLYLSLVICEGVATHLDFSRNNIDQNGYEPIETLLKYQKSIEFVDFSKNHILGDQYINPLWVKNPKSKQHLLQIKSHYEGSNKKTIKI